MISKQWQPKQIFATPFLQEQAKVTTQESISRMMKRFSMPQLYTSHYLDESLSLQLLQLPSAKHTIRVSTIQQRANILQAMLFGKSSLPTIRLLQFHC